MFTFEALENMLCKFKRLLELIHSINTVEDLLFTGYWAGKSLEMTTALISDAGTRVSKGKLQCSQRYSGTWTKKRKSWSISNNGSRCSQRRRYLGWEEEEGRQALMLASKLRRLWRCSTGFQRPETTSEGECFSEVRVSKQFKKRPTVKVTPLQAARGGL